MIPLFHDKTPQERTGAVPSEGQEGGGGLASTSAVQQVEEAYGVPVVSVVGLSHLTAYMASKGDHGGADAEVRKAKCDT